MVQSDQQRHRLVQAVQRVARRVEEEDVAQAEHQARHRHRQHRQQAHQRRAARRGRASSRAGRRRRRRATVPKNAVPAAIFRLLTKRVADLGVDQAHAVVVEARRQVVRPELANEANIAMPSIASISSAISAAVGDHRRVEAARRLAARTAPRAPSASPSACAAPASRRAKVSTAGASSSSADHRAALEVLLADHELEDVGGEHVEVAADHLRDAEVGDRPA